MGSENLIIVGSGAILGGSDGSTRNLRSCRYGGMAWLVAMAAITDTVIWGLSDANIPITLSSVAGGVAGLGVFNIAAWLMILRHAFDLAGETDTTAAGPIGFAGFTLFCLIPSRHTTGIAMAVLAAILLFGRAVTAAGRRAGWLLAALASGVISARFLSPLHVAVGRVDAHLVAAVLRLFGVPAGVEANIIVAPMLQVEVLPPCAATHGLAEVTVAYLVIVLFQRRRLLPLDLPWLAASLLASVVLSEARLCLLATDPNSFQYWHYGTGNTLYEYAALASAAAFPLLASRRRAG